jgi:hypothetical protein
MTLKSGGGGGGAAAVDGGGCPSLEGGRDRCEGEAGWEGVRSDQGRMTPTLQVAAEEV